MGKLKHLGTVLAIGLLVGCSGESDGTGINPSTSVFPPTSGAGPMVTPTPTPGPVVPPTPGPGPGPVATPNPIPGPNPMTTPTPTPGPSTPEPVGDGDGMDPPGEGCPQAMPTAMGACTPWGSAETPALCGYGMTQCACQTAQQGGTWHCDSCPTAVADGDSCSVTGFTCGDCTCTESYLAGGQRAWAYVCEADEMPDAGMPNMNPPKKFTGNITTGGRVRDDFVMYWNQITPENEGKWGSVERVRDQMEWGGLDAAYNYAKQHNIPFKQHTFVWGSQQPDWIGRLSQAEQRDEVEEWIRLYCERYPDTQLIDVVNEPPPHTTPPYVAALGGAGASGYDWIVQSFKWARQYCPNAILILNDYNTIEYGNDNSHFIDIVNRIRNAGAPIDAIGAQAHAAYNMPTATVKGYLDKLAATGLPVYISEYDINLADDARQRAVMESQFTMFWEHEAVPGITLWGYVQGQTWLANTGLMSSSGNQRPAMSWLMGFLAQQP